MTPARTAKARPELTPKQQLASIASLPSIHSAFAWFRKNTEMLCQLQIDVASIPAPPFGEATRGASLKKRFAEAGLKQVQMDEVGNVIGVRKGSDPGATALAVVAHMDTVFPAGTAIKIRRERSKLLGPGISDNGSGLTALMALAMVLEAVRISHARSIVFVASVGEEGEGDLRGVRHFFSSSPWKNSVGSVLVVDGAGTETIVNQALGSRRFEVTVRGHGGHSWTDFGEPNPIAILAQAIAEFYRTDANPATKKKSAYNVGTIQGGTSVNSIPQTASMRVDLRSESAAEIDRLEAELRRAVAHSTERSAQSNGSGRKPEVKTEINRIGERPAGELDAGSRILGLMRAVDQHLGINSHLHCSSTDANIPLSLGKEAISIGAGGGGGGAHTLDEWFDITGRELGLKRVLLAALAIAGVEEGE